MNIIYQTIKYLGLVSAIIGYLLWYKNIFRVTGIFATRHFKPAKKNHKYAILVAARNEEAVIANLVDSIRRQNYPQDLVDIFVVADNCTDKTAEEARRLGAVCYERFDSAHRTKGFALQFLVECIRKDYGINAYEAYFIFDADNLLHPDYLKNMNDAFDAGEKIVTSYRNTKNFGDNWISASYGIHWLRTVRNEHRAKSLFRLATRIQGTGFMFANELIENGWNYTSLTEDRAFCADAVANGYKISYNHNAVFYDEQPVSLKIALRQRVRWAKGHLQAFTETGWQLFSHIFVTGGKENACVTGEISTFRKIVNNLRLRFMSFDMLTICYPRAMLLEFKKILVYILRVVLICGGELTVTANFAPPVFRKAMALLGIAVAPDGKISSIAVLFLFLILWTINGLLNGIVTAVYVYIIEYKRIPHIAWHKKIFYCITFPLFDLIGKFSLIAALFMKVEWKPIPHNAAISIADLESVKETVAK